MAGASDGPLADRGSREDQGEDNLDTPGLGAYLDVLKGRRFRLLWAGEVVNVVGSWLNYVATLTVIEELGGHSAILLSLALIMRFMPSVFFFPVAGVVADRYSKERTLSTSCFIAAILAMSLAIVQVPSMLWFLYLLLFFQFSATSFYDPARRALIPTIVAKDQLNLAATLDALGWSTMSACGAALGGLAVSHLGTSACFFMDGATYAVAGACAWQLRRENEKIGDLQLSGSESDDDLLSQNRRRRSSVEVTISVTQPRPRGTAAADGTAPSPSKSQTLQHQQQRQADSREPPSLAKDGAHGGSKAPRGCLAMLRHSFADELAAMQDGFRFVAAAENREVAALVLIKASGSIVWGAADVMYVRFAELPAMQGLGDVPTTMGLIFGFMGVGCAVGPIVMNRFTPNVPQYLLRSTAIAFVAMLVGYLLMSGAPNIWLLLAATVVRSLGSAALWIYSTLLIQLRVQADMLGRMFALEMAFFTIMEASSGLWGGYMFDGLRLTPRQSAGVMAGVSAVVSSVWVAYAWVAWRRAKRRGGAFKQAYELVPQAESGASAANHELGERDEDSIAV